MVLWLARRIGALVLKLQMWIAAFTAAVVGLFVATVILILIAVGISGSAGSDEVAIITIFVAMPVTALLLFLAGRRARRVMKLGETALDRAVESADRMDQRFEEARSGGPPGQLSVVAPDQAGELSTVAEAGALSEAPGRKQTS